MCSEWTHFYAWYKNRSCGATTVNQDPIRSGSNQKYITPTSWVGPWNEASEGEPAKVISTPATEPFMVQPERIIAVWDLD